MYVYIKFFFSFFYSCFISIEHFHNKSKHRIYAVWAGGLGAMSPAGAAGGCAGGLEAKPPAASG